MTYYDNETASGPLSAERPITKSIPGIDNYLSLCVNVVKCIILLLSYCAVSSDPCCPVLDIEIFVFACDCFMNQ